MRRLSPSSPIRAEQHHVVVAAEHDDARRRSLPRVEHRKTHLALEHSTIGGFETIDANGRDADISEQFGGKPIVFASRVDHHLRRFLGAAQALQAPRSQRSFERFPCRRSYALLCVGWDRGTSWRMRKRALATPSVRSAKPPSQGRAFPIRTVKRRARGVGARAGGNTARQFGQYCQVARRHCEPAAHRSADRPC